MSLTLLDYLIIGVPLALVLAVGIIMRRYTHTVADYLAANRCAGRYLLTTAASEIGAAVMGTVIALEVFSRTGFSLGFWGNFSSVIFFMLTLFGVISFRYRETRCLTFHQFFEVRYSKGLRVFSSFINIFSGLINFGLVPAVGARFFVYFVGLPEHIAVAGMTVPTFAVLMTGLMVASMLLALSGGQISVMVTDCIEALVSGVFYLVVAFFVVATFSLAQVKQALLSGGPGNSYVNPFDIGNRHDFNGWYIVLALVFNIAIFRGNAWNQGFSAAAKSAHEGRMASILGSWRGYASAAMGALIAIGAFTLLHHPDFAAQQELVAQGLAHIETSQLRTQMTMPMALGVLLTPGVKGAFCAIGLFGLLASQGMQLHSYGSTLLQDVILPFRKTPMSPRAHLIALRLSAISVGIFACTFSLLYKPVDYLTLMVTLIGAIYLGGIGPIVWGGLYWKKGTTAGAWTAMITGSALAILCNILQQFWVSLHPLLAKWAGTGRLGRYLVEHPDKCPINGMQFTVGTMICTFAGYVVVSRLTCKRDFNMDRMLYRREYAIDSENEGLSPIKRGFSWGKLIGIDEHFSRGDKVLSVATFGWSMTWQLVAVCILLWWIFVGRLSDGWWFNYTMITGVAIPMVLAVITTVWFTIGTIRDLFGLFESLKRASQNIADDGTVRDHACVVDRPGRSHADGVAESGSDTGVPVARTFRIKR